MDEISGKDQPGPLVEMLEELLPGAVVHKDKNLCLFLTAEDTTQGEHPYCLLSEELSRL